MNLKKLGLSAGALGIVLGVGFFQNATLISPSSSLLTVEVDPCASISVDSRFVLPTLLSKTCLYTVSTASLVNKTVNYSVSAYTPRYPLWSDGAVKQRYVYLPPRTKIDSTDMENWKYPVGTRLWKEFIVNGKRVETRFLIKTAEGQGPTAWLYGTYAWSADGLDAVLSPSGVTNALGTGYTIPSANQCMGCHRSSPDVSLGFTALQLNFVKPPAENYVTLAGLSSQDRLTIKPDTTTSFEIVGTDVDKAALGYLHANCGSCHTPGGSAAFSGMNLKYNRVASMTASNAYITSLNSGKVVPGHPEQSRIYIRMGTRPFGGMPAFSRVVDPSGMSAVAAWIIELNTVGDVR